MKWYLLCLTVYSSIWVYSARYEAYSQWCLIFLSTSSSLKVLFAWNNANTTFISNVTNTTFICEIMLILHLFPISMFSNFADSLKTARYEQVPALRYVHFVQVSLEQIKSWISSVNLSDRILSFSFTMQCYHFSLS